MFIIIILKKYLILLIIYCNIIDYVIVININNDINKKLSYD